MHPTPQAAASTLQPPDRAPADSLPACAEPGHLGHEAKNSLMPPAMAASLAAALLVACGGGGGDTAPGTGNGGNGRSEEHTSELQSQSNLVCRLLLEKKKKLTIRALHS